MLCQYTLEPVGDGYEIEAPRDTIPTLLPLMVFGLKAMQTLNGVASLGKMLLGPAVPTLPQAFLNDAEDMLAETPSNLEQFTCVLEAAHLAAELSQEPVEESPR